MKFADKLYYKHPNWGIKNMMLHISIVTAIAYVLQYIFRSNIISFLYLDRAAVFSGQIWRVLTFIFVPPSTGILWLLLALYFYYFIGSTLEATWGTLKFNIYYLLSMLGTIAAALLFGGVYTGVYVNLSMFLAFAYLYPDHQVLLFFIIPVKMKYLAYVDVALLAYSFIMGGLSTKLAIIASLTGFLVFFGGDLINRIKSWIRRQKYKNRY